LKTVLNSNPEELQVDESKLEKRRKNNLSKEGDEEQERLPSRKKTRKRDPGLVFFLPHITRQSSQQSTTVHLCMRMMMTMPKSVKR